MDCIVCSGKVSQELPYPYLSKTNPFKIEYIRQCSQCGFGQANPMPTGQMLEQFYSSGEYWHDSIQSLILHSNQSAFRLNYLKRMMEEKGPWPLCKVLDVGAGLGTIAHYLPDEGTDYYYQDQDQSIFRQLPQRVGVKYHYLENLETEIKFDFIFCNHVLEHTNNPQGFLQKLKGLLGANGIIYLEVPNADYRFKNDVFPHVLFFNDTALKTLLGNEGFEVLDFRIFGSLSKNPQHIMNKIFCKLMGLAHKAGFIKLSQSFYAILHGIFLNRDRSPDGIWLSALIRKK